MREKEKKREILSLFSMVVEVGWRMTRAVNVSA